MAWTGVNGDYITEWSYNTALDKGSYFTRDRLNNYIYETGEIVNNPEETYSDGIYIVEYKPKDDDQIYKFVIDDYGNINEFSEIIISCESNELLQDNTAIVRVNKISNDLKNKEIVWNTNDEDKVVVEDNGNSAKITAVSGGIVKITAKVDDKISNECTITILNKLSSIEDFEDVSLEEGNTLQLTFPEYTENAICSTAENEYVSVTSEGLISALKETVSPIEITITGDSGIEKIVNVTVTKVRTAVDVLKVNLSATKDEEKSPYVIYESEKVISGDSKDILCRVLYNDMDNGLQIVSVDSVRSVSIGGYQRSQNSDCAWVQAVSSLNKFSCEFLKKSDEIALDGRCVGSRPTVSENGDSGVLYFSNKDYIYPYEFSTSDDNNHTQDVSRLNLINATSSCWLGSRKLYIWKSNFYYYVCYYGETVSSEQVAYSWGGTNHSESKITHGLRIVILVNPLAELTGSGDNLGSESNPYRLISGNGN